MICCCSFVALSVAQSKLPRCGQDFTFGVIEGAERLVRDTEADHIRLTILSASDGDGSYSSPSGPNGVFTFKAGTPTVIVLPLDLIQINDLGKTSKGILIHTSVPVNIIFQNTLSMAGDATQLYPDEALDTAYVVSNWGLFNDPGEDNRSEFLISATKDNTHLTIVPSVNTLLGQQAGVPFTVSLMRGETYIVKADSTCLPLLRSLWGSTISSDHPVSVIVGVTCAYVPLSFESCNELVDELLGKKWWGTKFFVQPPGPGVPYKILITSDTIVAGAIDGDEFILYDHKAELQSTKPAFIEINAPAELHLLSFGSFSAVGGRSDPSMVSVLPMAESIDTLLWNTAAVGDGAKHYASIVYPTADASYVILDNKPIFMRSERPVPFRDSSRSSLLTEISEGTHTLISAVPVSVLAFGFSTADAYSFIPGTSSHSSLSTKDSWMHPNSSFSTVRIYPNPSQDAFEVVSTSSIFEVQLIDQLGRTIEYIRPDTNSAHLEEKIDVTNIQNGSYLLRAVTDEGVVIKRFEVLR